MRKPRRKKAKFVFKRKAGRIICNDQSSGFYMKQVSKIIFMGHFGYHHVHIDWTVFHIPTGLDVCYCEEEKEARIIVKKLFAKVWSGNWKNIDSFKVTFELQVLVSQIKSVLKREDFPFENKKCSVCGKNQFKTPSGVSCINGHGGAPSVFRPNPDDDIPF